MQSYDVVIAPGQTLQLSVKGKYIRYESGYAAGDDESLSITAGSGMSMVLRSGQAVRLEHDEVDWFIAKAGTGSNSVVGRVVIGNGGMEDSRVPGVVSISDTSTQRVKDGKAFFGMVAVAAVAGQYACVQLWNPVGSGRAVYLTAGIGQFVSTGNTDICFQTAALSNLGTAISKRPGTGTPLAQLRYESRAANPEQGYRQNVLTSTANNGVMSGMPIRLDEGWGVAVRALALNDALTASLEWWEEMP